MRLRSSVLLLTILSPGADISGFVPVIWSSDAPLLHSDR